MAQVCNGCAPSVPSAKTETPKKKAAETKIPFIVYESSLARSERCNKRLWIIILVLIGALIGTNFAWIAYESQFDTYSYDYTQDGNGNNIIGNANEVDYNGAETENTDTQEKGQ